MDNGQRAIIIGVSVFVTILIISIVLYIANLGLDAADSGKDNIIGISDTVKVEVFKNQFMNSTVKFNKVREALTQYADTLFIAIDEVGTNTNTYHTNTTKNVNASTSDLYFISNSVGKYFYKTDSTTYTTNTTTPRKFFIQGTGTATYQYTNDPTKYNGASTYTRYYIYKTDDPSSDIIGLYFKATGET